MTPKLPATQIHAEQKKSASEEQASASKEVISSATQHGTGSTTQEASLRLSTANDTESISQTSGKKSAEEAAAHTDVEPKKRALEISVPITVKELSQLIGVRTTAIIQKLFENEHVAITLNQALDKAMVETIAIMFEKEIVIKTAESPEEVFLREFNGTDAPGDLVLRAPIVTFMGHVNHGKTSLLDSIRHTNLVDKEAGGITQYIGSYKLQYKDQAIVFLDTPGHEAFTSMRARGANVTDIVVLVVAADDGVMPQTLEAVSHAKAANLEPGRVIVAVNKMDLPQFANEKARNDRLERIMQQLAKHEPDLLTPERWGGKAIYVEVSALTKKGIDDLLDNILLVAEINELKANPKHRAYGTVLETKILEGKGVVATVMVQNGTLRQGDIIVCGSQFGRVKDITNHLGKRIKEAGPSTPVEVSGFDHLPDIGDKFYVAENQAQARMVAEANASKKRRTPESDNASAEGADPFKVLLERKKQGLRIVLKTDVQGSLEAIQGKLRLPEFTEKEIKFYLLHAGVGPISEGDVELADASHGVIFGFNVTASSKAEDLAKKKGIAIYRHNVIYQLLENIKELMSGLLKPTITEEHVGRCVIRKIIHISKVGNVAGCFVTAGMIERSSQLRLYRDGILVNKDKPLAIGSLKRFSEDVSKVKEGFECGIKVNGYEDIKEGDELHAFKLISVQRTLE